MKAVGKNTVSGGSEWEEEARSALQRRVALFGGTAGGIGAGFLLVRVLRGLADPDVMFDDEFWSLVWHGVAASLLLLVWVLLLRGAYSSLFIHTVESVGLVFSCAAYAVMGTFIPTAFRPEYILLLALSIGFMSRSVYVPSRAIRTFLLSMIVGIVLLGAVYWIFRDNDPSVFMAADSRVGQLTSEEFTAFIILNTGVWWLAISILATATSRVIYGLRREARKARKLGQYTLERKLGEGGMGEVYRARHAMLRRPTAVKLLRPDKTGEASLARFEREVQLTASLTHPNTVTIYDYGRTPEGVFYYAMELLDGPTLEKVVQVDGAQPPARVVWILSQVAGALREAHEVGLIHRDIKPANVMLVEHGGVLDVVKVVDFGLVKDIHGSGDPSLSRAETITGTPQYLAPETISSPEKRGRPE